MTVVAVALVALLLVVVVGAGEAVRRQLRSGERRERQLVELLRERDRAHAEVLDRVLYAAGKPWKNTADRPDPDPAPDPDEFDFGHVTEDPPPGGFYAGDVVLDELDDDLRSDAGDTVFVPERFDTAGLEVT